MQTTESNTTNTSNTRRTNAMNMDAQYDDAVLIGMKFNGI